jgi:hypothetical protein
VNFTPNSTDDASPESIFVGVPPKSKIVSLGVTAPEGADSTLGPTEFVALTVNVYAVPFVNPDTFALVAGGDPVTVVTGCAADPIYGVTV